MGNPVRKGFCSFHVISKNTLKKKKKNQVVRNPKNSTEILGSIFVSILDIP